MLKYWFNNENIQTSFQWVCISVFWRMVSFQKLPSLNDTLSILQLPALTLQKNKERYFNFLKSPFTNLNQCLFKLLMLGVPYLMQRYVWSIKEYKSEADWPISLNQRSSIFLSVFIIYMDVDHYLSLVNSLTKFSVTFYFLFTSTTYFHSHILPHKCCILKLLIQ